MKHIRHTILLLCAAMLASCASSPEPPAPDDWETEFHGFGPVPVTIVNTSSRPVKLRLAEVDGTTAGQVQLNGNGSAQLRLKPDAYQSKVRIMHAGAPKYYLAPPVAIYAGTASVRLTLKLSDSTNLTEIDEAEFNH